MGLKELLFIRHSPSLDWELLEARNGLVMFQGQQEAGSQQVFDEQIPDWMDEWMDDVASSRN